MLKNYLTIAFRNLLKHKVYSSISILGLAVGISFFTLIFLLISHELSHDRFHSKSDRTYRVIQFLEQNGVGEKSASVPFPLAPTIKHFSGLVEDAVRIFNFQVSSHKISSKLHAANEKKFYFTDDTFFDLFDFTLAQGNPDSVLLRPMSVILTQQSAKKYFGDENPIGKKLLYENRLRFTVTGILEEIGHPSHFEFDFLASFSSLDIMLKYTKNEHLKDNWVWNPCWTYISLKEGAKPEELEDKLKILVERLYEKPFNKHAQLFLQPLEEIHLFSNLDYEISRNGDIRYIYIFSGIAFLMLILTTTNFTNLSTARSSVRAKEIGIRKAIGADRSELIEQFLVESIFISMLSIFFSLILVELLLPVISELLGDQIDLTKADKTILLACIFASTIFVGVVASLYPSYYLARFKPSAVLNGTLSLGMKSKRIRSILIVLQLIITVFFLFSTFVSFKQATYLRNMNVGFASDDLLIVSLPDPMLRPLIKELKVELEENENIEAVTSMDEPLMLNHQTHRYYYRKNKNDDGFESMFFPAYLVGYGFLEALGLELVAGRDFDEELKDEEFAVIINEKMVEHMDWGSPNEALDKQLFMHNMNQRVVGVVKDFNYESLHKDIEPLVIDLNTTNIQQTKNIVVKSITGQLDSAWSELQEVWNEKVPDRELESFSLKTEMNKLYEGENRLGKISFYFASVSIFISILGLFGLSSFVVDQRKKEIAVRKALGVNDLELMLMLSKEFIQLVIISLSVAWSGSYLILEFWLDGFPFATQVGTSPFVVSGFLVLLITLGTVSYHIVRAGLKTPVQDLQAA